MTMGGNGGGVVSVPPGFRFHPTDEELLHYYLRKKVSYEPIDLDVIREVDLNKLEPWDLKEKCRIGSGPQDEWYLFSHKDKKYPTGTRTNRATAAGFWKATGRDKPIHLSSSKRIGMRKTLVFYTGRAPHGHKTDWIMHEYRLDDDNYAPHHTEIHEDGWVVCRVFKKKNHPRSGFQHADMDQEEQQPITSFGARAGSTLEQNQRQHQHQPPDHIYEGFSFDQVNAPIHLPQLLSHESTVPPALLYFSSNLDCPQNIAGPSAGFIGQHKISGDWSVLDKLLATHRTAVHHVSNGNQFLQVPTALRFPFSYSSFEPDISN